MDFELIIIGAGPAGISMAAEAIISGISREKILVLEKGEEHNWSIRKFYPNQKLVTANYKGNVAVCSGVMCIQDASKTDTLTYLDKAIQDYHIKVNYNEAVWKINKIGDTFEVGTSKDNYRAKTCAIAIGMMGRPNKPSYKIPAEIRDRVTYDITSKEIHGPRVLVVGGGDSASEYAQYLCQEGHQVTLSYRKEEFSRMNDINRQSIEALEQRGSITIMRKSNVQSLAVGLSECPLVHFEDGGQKSFEHIVLALGGSTPKNFLTLLGIEFDGDQPVIKDGYETSIPGLFLIGDLSAGKKGGSIITAFNSSHEAMKKICTDYLSCKI